MHSSIDFLFQQIRPLWSTHLVLDSIAYLAVFLFLLLFAGYIYIRLRYGFWVYQPVFHIYDLPYYLFPPGIVSHSLPSRNKYTQFRNIDTRAYTDLSDYKKSSFVHFIQLHYLRHGTNTYQPSANHIWPYFIGHSHPSFVSFYQEPQTLLHQANGSLVTREVVVGTITSRPLQIQIFRLLGDGKFDAYYVDFLCVDQGRRKSGIACQLIQTHEYNQRHLNPSIVVSIFKREDDLTGIVPLCAYTTYGYSLHGFIAATILDASYKILEVTKQNYFHVHDFIEEVTRETMEISIIPSVGNIVELLQSKNIYGRVLLHQEQILAAYFFRKTSVWIDAQTEVLSCIASLMHPRCSRETFQLGFLASLGPLVEEYGARFLAMEKISHNHLLMDTVCQEFKKEIESPTAYYFYNFVYPTFSANQVFILQ